MNPLRWLERQIFLGEVIRDYGYIERRYNDSTRIYLVRRRNELCLMIKRSKGLPFFGTRYYHIRPNRFAVATEVLRDIERLPLLEPTAVGTDGVGPIDWPKVIIFFLALSMIVLSELVSRGII